jgi:hypothetical protein
MCTDWYGARQWLGINVTAAMNTHTQNVGRAVLCEIRVVSKESLWVSVYPPIVDRYRLGKEVPAATRDCWRRRFL